ncbi:hypothetical protein J5J83_07590 [Azoarcus sp. L1K30]|uniref:tetratricopeptide repeat protein n=1 Tax=Azoarcus sp. L1K30 TaxID=2820277 RepID=UPI001B81A93D|nr:hypothetical protein [Azoarcus sp. L1K30]MBR0565975.1 hypothetical protein [Azoarcus sp. L1K30]
MHDLDIAIRDKIDAAFRNARQKFNDGDIPSALAIATEAWHSLPEPKFGWDVSKSYTHAYASLHRDAGVFDEAIKVMKALFASGTVRPNQDRPHFILGTIYYEMGDLENAKRSFAEANRISKGRCFNEEPEKYLSTLTR